MSGIIQNGLGQQKESINIYSESLNLHLKNLKAVNALKGNTVYIERDEISTVGLPEEINDVRIICLSRKEVRMKTKNGGGINLIVIKPVKVELKTLEVVLIDFYVSSKGKNFFYGNGGGSVIKFKYNCETEEFEYSENKYLSI
jgi:hypothetical protein